MFCFFSCKRLIEICFECDLEKDPNESRTADQDQVHYSQYLNHNCRFPN